MKADVIVLAGADKDEKLRAANDSPYKCLIDIHGRPMIEYVLDALVASEYVDGIVIVGPEEVAPLLERRGESRITLAPCQGSLVENLRIGVERLQPRRQVLVSTCDIPLLTKAGIDDFFDRCSQHNADIYYPIVTREVNEERFPGVKRTYVRLKEDVYTGGNVALLDPNVVGQCHTMIQRAVQMRKKPVQLSRLLGFRFILKLLFNRLSLTEVEHQVERVLGFKGLGVVCPYPEIGIDVDKPSDLDLVREALGRPDDVIS